jgi:DNA-binding NtrC family response regulator
MVVFTPEDQVDEKGLEAALTQCVNGSDTVTGQPCIDSIAPYLQEKNRVLSAFTGEYMDNLLKITGGNISQAARVAGLSRQALQKIMVRKGIDSDAYRT